MTVIQTIAAPFQWLWQKFNSFEDWCASIAPGIKTKLVTALGAIGSAAALGQEFLTGLPTKTFVTDSQLATISLVLFTLAFWFRRISDKA